MTKTKNNHGNAMPLVLAVLLLVGLGVAGWLYFSKQNPDAAVIEDVVTEQTNVPAAEAPVVSETTEPTDPALEETAPMVTDETTAAAPSPATDAPAASSAPSSYDFAKATSVRAIGSADAPIKIVEYASMTCSHCAHFHNDVLPALKTKYIDTGKVQIEFKEFPLDDAALKATITARCLPEDKYDGFVALLFKTQEHWARGIDYMAALRQNAKLAGMSDATFDACHADEKLKLAIADWMQQGQDKWKINATPTFIINDGVEKVSGAQPLPEFERIFRKVSGDAIGEAPAVE